MTTLRIERTYPHPREKVWRALTEPELLARWLMPNDFAARVGHRFTFETEPGPGFDGVVRCEVLEVVRPTRLVYTWVGGPLDTRLAFTLEETREGTRLIVEQSGFRGARAWLVSRILKAGNRTIYGRRLPEVLVGIDDPTHNESPHDEACMTRGQGVVTRLLAWLPGRKRR